MAGTLRSPRLRVSRLSNVGALERERGERPCARDDLLLARQQSMKHRVPTVGPLQHLTVEVARGRVAEAGLVTVNWHRANRPVARSGCRLSRL